MRQSSVYVREIFSLRLNWLSLEIRLNRKFTDPTSEVIRGLSFSAFRCGLIEGFRSISVLKAFWAVWRKKPLILAH